MKKNGVFKIENPDSVKNELTLQIKGSPENPYTVEEFEMKIDRNEWNGGYVLGIGNVSADSNDPNSVLSYGYGEWNFDFNFDDNGEYIYTYKNESEGVIGSGNDCAYLCVSKVFNIPAAQVADMYGCWIAAKLKHDTDKDELDSSEEKAVKNAISKGMDNDLMNLFLRTAGSTYGYNVALYTERFGEAFSSSDSDERKKIALVKNGLLGGSHAVLINSVLRDINGQVIKLKCDDPQLGKTDVEYEYADLLNLFVFYMKQ